MERGQFVEMKDCAFVEWQSGDLMLLTLFSDEAFKRAGQRQLSKGMLDGDLPDGHCAEQGLIRRIGKEMDSCGGEFFCAGKNP